MGQEARSWLRTRLGSVSGNLAERVVDAIPMPLGSLTAVDEARGLVGGLGAGSGVIVEVEDERLKVLAKGARCVSLSSGAVSDASRSEETVARAITHSL